MKNESPKKTEPTAVKQDKISKSEAKRLSILQGIENAKARRFVPSPVSK